MYKYTGCFRFAFLILVATLPFAPLRAETVKIGAFLCQSGACADWGQAAFRGATLAAEEVNARGGVLGHRLELVLEDSQDSVSGARAVTAFTSLLQRDIKLFIGPTWAPGALAVAPVAVRQKGILVVTPSASAPEFSRSATFMFNARPLEEPSTIALASHAFARGQRRVGILSSQQPAEYRHGRLFRDEFEKSGGMISSLLEPVPNATDLKTEIALLLKDAPEAVFLMCYNQLAEAARQLRAANFKGSVYAVSVDQARVTEAAGAFEGMIIATAGLPALWFKEKFRQRFGSDPGMSAENGYDTLLALSEAIIMAGSLEVGPVRDRLAEETFQGAVGSFRFNADRQLSQPPVLMQVRQGVLGPL